MRSLSTRQVPICAELLYILLRTRWASDEGLRVIAEHERSFGIRLALGTKVEHLRPLAATSHGLRKRWSITITHIDFAPSLRR